MISFGDQQLANFHSLIFPYTSSERNKLLILYSAKHYIQNFTTKRPEQLANFATLRCCSRYQSYILPRSLRIGALGHFSVHKKNITQSCCTSGCEPYKHLTHQKEGALIEFRRCWWYPHNIPILQFVQVNNEDCIF